jgi:hypothetical protein
MRRIALVGVPTLVAVALLAWALDAFGGDSVPFAFVAVWAPMTWLGTVSRVVQPRLPAWVHELRPFERDGRLYERLGVRAAKRLLRRGPLAAFNPDLHLPAEPTPERVRHLDGRMRDAEASHLILFVATLAVVANAVVRGWWGAAAWTSAFDLLLNGYPVMLQRYNRAMLRRRFGATATGIDAVTELTPAGGRRRSGGSGR